MPAWAVAVLVPLIVAGVAGVWKIAFNTGTLQSDVRTLQSEITEVKGDVKELYALTQGRVPIHHRPAAPPLKQGILAGRRGNGS